MFIARGKVWGLSHRKVVVGSSGIRYKAGVGVG